MLTAPRDPTTVDELQRLLEDIYRARDTLYVAASSLVAEDHSFICHWLGDRLGGHAADLQQIIAASGRQPMNPPSQQEIGTMLASAQTQEGDRGVLFATEQIEQLLRDRYIAAAKHFEDEEIRGFIEERCGEVEFASRVLRVLAAAN